MMETSEKLNLQDLIDLLAEKTSLSKKEIELFLRELFAIIPESITENDPVKLKNFGTFKLTPIQSRESIDVNTGEKIEIPAHYRLGFTPASALKELVNKPFSHFETVLLNDGVSFEGITENTNTPDFEEEEGEEIIVKTPTITESPVIAPPEKEQPQSTGSDMTIDRNRTPKRKRRERGRLSKSGFLIVSLVVIAIAAAFFLKIQDDKSMERYLSLNSNVAAQNPELPLSGTENDTVVTDKAVEEQPQSTIIPSADTIVLTAGKTLRLIALDKFGNRQFWIYIYLKNKDKIKNPDVVPVGTKLLLPDKSEYDMEADDAESVEKAKKLGDEEMKKFW